MVRSTRKWRSPWRTPAAACGPEEKDHLFEKFRLSRTKADGSGLGLYICKTLVEANHGRIWVDSDPGRGAAFHLAFPAAAGEAEASEA